MRWSKERDRCAQLERRGSAGLAAQRRRPAGISRSTEGLFLATATPRWARKGRARIIFACLIPAPDKFLAASAMSCSKRQFECAGGFGSTGFSLCGFSLNLLRARSDRSRWTCTKADRLKPVPLSASLILFCVLFCALFSAIPARATTYYVAAAGSDANVGTDTGHPWQTISKVSGSTFSAGDSVLFNRGDVWYGTSLTVPSSGTNGAPILFGAYGSGANPIIKGSTLLVTSGYVLAPNTSANIFSLGDSGTSSTDSATRNWREQVSHLDISASATTIRSRCRTQSTA